MGECTFYLGTHRPHWLRLLDVPLFVSRRTLAPYRTLPRARCAWALDSGGFTEIKDHGEWTVSAKDYAGEVRRIAAEVGQLAWAAPQDWMCEPVMLTRTGLTVEEHQRRSVQSFLDLRDLAPELPWIPVLQGWRRDDYLRCWSMYERAGVMLDDQPVVGVGSVCRRQGTSEAVGIFQALQPLKLHGFGVKSLGLKRGAALLTSSDSMAWSYRAFKHGRPLCGSSAHNNCANCIDYALWWRDRVVAGIEDVGGEQMGLFA